MTNTAQSRWSVELTLALLMSQPLAIAGAYLLYPQRLAPDLWEILSFASAALCGVGAFGLWWRALQHWRRSVTRSRRWLVALGLGGPAAALLYFATSRERQMSSKPESTDAPKR
jgi:drug/metabolite transporter (DMT)-like permease